MELFGDEFEICPHCGYVVGTHAEEAIHIEPGTLLYDRYIVGKVLGYGGFGVTYLGWDGKLEQKVAIKEYLPGEFSTRMPGQSHVTVFNGEKNEQFHDGLKKFVEEAKHLAKFQNEQGIVKIFDSFEENDTAYIIMEYLDGETLTEYLKREKTIPEDVAVAMLMPVMESLQAVHDAGLLHRDIAPDNIFLTKSGEVKLIDFGASRYATTSHSRSLTVIIKPGYSPEEQYRSRGDQGPHTDVYAIASTLYKMITGKTPPDAMERRAKYENQNKDILEEPHKINKKISINRENAILNAMNVRIEDRTPDVATFIRDLNADPPVKRIYGKIKKIDLYSWPLWLKIFVPSLLSVILAFGALLLTGVIKFSNFTEEIIIPENIVIVPDVEGLYKDEALQLITAGKLLASTDGSVESEYIPAGKIILQTPVGDSYMDINGTVLLMISSGKGVESPENGLSTVPYVIWDSKDDTASSGGTKITSSTKVTITSAQTLYAQWTVNAYKLTYNANGGSVSTSSKPVTYGNTYGTLPTPTRDYCTFKGWYTAASGGSKVSSSTVMGAGDVTIYAQWTFNTLSDWVLSSKVPSGAQVVENKWTYTRTQTTESTNSSLSGWTKTGEYWRQTGSGSTNYATFPTGYDTNNTYYKNFAKSPYSAYDNGSTKREVSNWWSGYIYWHWMYSVAYANTTVRPISHRYGSWDAYGNSGGFNYKYFFAIASSVDCPYLDKSYCCSQNLPSYNCHSIITNTTNVGTPRCFRFNYYTSSYTDYEKVYQYKSVTTGNESSTQITAGGEISNVQHYVRYRVK